MDLEGKEGGGTKDVPLSQFIPFLSSTHLFQFLVSSLQFRRTVVGSPCHGLTPRKTTLCVRCKRWTKILYVRGGSGNRFRRGEGHGHLTSTRGREVLGWIGETPRGWTVEGWNRAQEGKYTASTTTPKESFVYRKPLKFRDSTSGLRLT